MVVGFSFTYDVVPTVVTHVDSQDGRNKRQGEGKKDERRGTEQEDNKG